MRETERTYSYCVKCVQNRTHYMSEYGKWKILTGAPLAEKQTTENLVWHAEDPTVTSDIAVAPLRTSYH